jgi:hypothetical protein
MLTHTNRDDVHATRNSLASRVLFRQSGGGLGYEVDRWGAGVGLVGGPAAALLGVSFLAAGSIAGAPDPALSLTTASNCLLFSVIPLLLAGAHFLDRLEDRLDESEADQKQVSPSPDAGARTTRRVTTQGRIRLVRGLGIVALVAFAIAGASTRASAQQTIFNVPSTDVLDEGKVYFELDVTWKPVDPKFSSLVPRVVVGTGGRVEVGLNITGNIQPGDDVTTIQPAFKWKAYDGGSNGWAVAAGDNISVPVRNKPYDVGNYAYAEVSKSFKTGTRITAGGYHFSENVVAPAQRAGGQFGLEQTVTSWLNVNADWFTGKHASGYFTPGIAFKPHPKVTGYVGYSIGNTGASDGNHFVYTAVGINFN